MAILVDNNCVSYNDSIIKHWPTFASTNGDFEKAKIRVKDVMRHESGMVRMDKCYDLENFMPDKIKVRTYVYYRLYFSILFVLFWVTG